MIDGFYHAWYRRSQDICFIEKPNNVCMSIARIVRYSWVFLSTLVFWVDGWRCWSKVGSDYEVVHDQPEGSERGGTVRGPRPQHTGLDGRSTVQHLPRDQQTNGEERKKVLCLRRRRGRSLGWEYELRHGWQSATDAGQRRAYSTAATLRTALRGRYSDILEKSFWF